ncbi:hypothetical protein [Pelagicoccus sp. SDUM812003]|uniref:hypothetical protein n=1 Tax=Pelagicoccus sp. SDUM812003 TaxID=3041267 RepID=UPI00280F1139|nr:hypothetical protein [Pelagicoccus sp. SDUM812003]MDQ8203448.1 hypothetical protein [Pelagicoccus sp. SDUM812003]
MSTPLVYLILGSKGSGQFNIVSDLIEFGTDKDETSLVYCSENDRGDADQDFSVRSREASLGQYLWKDGALSLQIPGDASVAFVVADGVSDPADFVEAFHAWLPGSGCDLGRVITVLNCELAIAQHVAFTWFDCCIHFSDVVLLGMRENVTNKQMKAFLDHYEQECFPCLFEYVKKGRVPNPALLLETQPRRISRIFDEPEVFEDDEEEDIEEEDVAGDPSRDHYLKRISGGRREHVLPHIAEYL